ncbi:MAG: hypothetical protein L3J52_03610, partial [Proteobacteria bacterium]|nr:hypothetical protein [Pseudomonadota bacterium]
LLACKQGSETPLMPFYSYQAVDLDLDCAFCRDGFDQLQKLHDPKLTGCPKCDSPVKKLITAANVATGFTSDQKNTLGQKNLEKNGFTQYRKISKGVYEKSAGKGPNIISAD